MRFCYINTANIYPHDIHLIDGLRQNGHEVIEICDKSGGFKKYANIARAYRAEKTPFDAVIVGFTCPHFVPLARLLTARKIIFNGVSSQYEANVISRAEESSGIISSIKWWLIDFISFHLSTKVLLESSAQIDFVHRRFLVPKRKLVLSWTGVDEKEFFFDQSVAKRDRFTVLFRGRFLAESGIDTVIEAAKLLEEKGVDFLIIGHGYLYKKVGALMDSLKPRNIEMITERISIAELRTKMLSCHISLGQLADHPRLLRTLPCKLFESLALGLPYLTGRNKAALELLEENKTCIAVRPGDAGDLAEKILYLKENPEVMKKVAEGGYRLHKEKLASSRLAEGFIHNCFAR